MFDSFLEFIATVILNFLYNKAITAAKAAEDKVKMDEERKEVNDANIKAYQSAKDRADRRKAALNLINRSKPT